MYILSLYSCWLSSFDLTVQLVVEHAYICTHLQAHPYTCSRQVATKWKTHVGAAWFIETTHVNTFHLDTHAHACTSITSYHYNCLVVVLHVCWAYMPTYCLCVYNYIRLGKFSCICTAHKWFDSKPRRAVCTELWIDSLPCPVIAYIRSSRAAPCLVCDYTRCMHACWVWTFCV